MLFFFSALPCGILVPQPVIEPASPALEAWSLNLDCQEVNKEGAF